MKILYFIIGVASVWSSVSSQNLNFPDPRLKAKLISLNIDTNNDGEISLNEAQPVTILNISSAQISNISGLENFPNLKELTCSYNPIVTLDASVLNLKYLECIQNPMLTTINISNWANDPASTDGRVHMTGNPQLTTVIANNSSFEDLYFGGNFQLNVISLNNTDVRNSFTCMGSKITTLDLRDMSSLVMLTCENNLLTDINVSGCSQLWQITCQNNRLQNLNVAGCSELANVSAHNNQLQTLDFSGDNKLESVYVYNNDLTSVLITSKLLQTLSVSENNLTTLDISGNQNLTLFTADQNNLRSLFIKSNVAEPYQYSFVGNPELQYICAGEEMIPYFKSLIQNPAYNNNCEINAYCTFVPGGDFYTIAGKAKYDADNNGCNETDLAFAGLKLEITNGSTTGHMIADENGNFSIAVQSGLHTVKPVFEVQEYFNPVIPVTFDFPNQQSPAFQDFCISANGQHSDLEITLVPHSEAIPGFQTTYDLIYKNKGNTMQSGSVIFEYNDAFSDFVRSEPAGAVAAVNRLEWNFMNLKPLETRKVLVTLEINTPTETPPVNADDVLSFIGTIQSNTADETPADNTFNLSQIVVNSLDPNDKTCLEGDTITPDHAGKYVHYVIRFENTGTFAAKNIVVKDMIDLSKFELNSIVPLAGSHLYKTKINDTGKIEFLFENINLPFEDANNDGYVAFKIKTKPTLVIGDSFSNKAEIYFDYNFPIITNTATTTLQALAVNHFELSDDFRLYPNPAGEQLHFHFKSTVRVSSLAIYDLMGRLVQTVANPETNAIEVSHLKTGNYFLKINSDKGTTNAKFAKK